MAIGLITYMDAARAEDVVDVITNISPSMTPLLSGLGTSQDAVQTLHEYLTATLASAADNAAAEAAAASTVDLTQPARANNFTQIFKDDIVVSGTEMAVKNYAGNPFEYQIEKNLKEHALDSFSMSSINVAISVNPVACHS